MESVTMHVRKGDRVEVVAGKDKGSQGEIIAAYPKTGRVIIEGVNRVTRHTRMQQTQRAGRSGGLVHREAPVDVSNVMVVDPDDGKPTRVGVRRDADGRPIRYSRRSGKDIS